MIIIEEMTIIVPIRWNKVNTSLRKKVANRAVIIGVGEKIIVAFDTSKYERVLYQQNKPKP